jgi:two-component system, LuxR family, response regulator FixJ
MRICTDGGGTKRMAQEQHLNGTEIFVVDDDETMRDTLSAVFTPEGCRVTCFAEGHSFLIAARARTPSCILLDVNMPGRSGLDMLRELDAPHYPAPILIVSGQGDVPTAVNAIRGGALDFIEKPIEAAAVVARVREAIMAWPRRPANGNGHGDGHLAQGYGTQDYLAEVQGAGLLTPREREVLARVIAGASNKEAGRTLGISPRTVEVHRARIMDKLGAKNAADLVRIVVGQGPRH